MRNCLKIAECSIDNNTAANNNTASKATRYWSLIVLFRIVMLFIVGSDAATTIATVVP